MIKRRTTLVCGIIAGLIFSLSACATTGIEGSRHTLYETLEQFLLIAAQSS